MVLASVSVIIDPEADHVNTSICPGVSIITWSVSDDRFSISPNTWSNLVENKFSDVIIAPFGPRPYCVMTSLYLTVSRISIFVLKIIKLERGDKTKLESLPETGVRQRPGQDWLRMAGGLNPPFAFVLLGVVQTLSCRYRPYPWQASM